MSPSSSRRLSALIDVYQADHGMTQKAMARRIGVTPQTLIQWRRGDGLRGRLPARSVLEAVATAIEAPWAAFVTSAVTAAAANAGGVDLLRDFRTEPIEILINPDPPWRQRSPRRRRRTIFPALPCPASRPPRLNDRNVRPGARCAH